MGSLAILAQFPLCNLAWWTVAVGNLLATLVMAGFFALRHPELWRTVFRARRGFKDPEVP